ncbi:FAD-dependent oxidoreductase [Macrococcoides goetzii]|uniref:FAD-dependent oxidoreductase n=1 Tax=Macrococcoides goetzii TaxID=1891097 RepID=A0A395GAX6_9STAP|nr:FAD-dependent oxidoreductase [Macrococcus goetzii]RAI81102.1 FAD-dependent oxidoreductase [Macrococcus goetzii]
MKNENQPYWRNSVTLLDFPVLTNDLTTEVAIVGAGMAGILTAYQLAKQGKKVTVIEARKVLEGTTAHTTAKLTVQHFAPYQQLIKEHGLEKTKKYYQSQKDALSLMRALKEEYQIEADFEDMSNFLLTAGEMEEFLKDELEAHRQIGIPSQYLEGDQGMPFKTTGALEITDQAQYNPLKFLSKMIEVCRNLGVEFYEQSPVKNIEENHLLTDTNVKVSFDKAVVTTLYPAIIHGEHFKQLQVERAYIISIKNTQELPFGMFQYVDEPMVSIRHFHKEDGVEVILAGANHLAGGKAHPKESYEALENIAKDMFHTTDVTGRWSAQDVNTEDLVPYIGRYTDNIYIATGFNKFGMLFSALTSLVLPDLIAGKDNPYQDLLDPHRKLSLKENIKGKLTEIINTAKSETMSLKDITAFSNPNEQTTITREDGQLISIYKENGKEYRLKATCSYSGHLLSYNDAEQSWDCPHDGSRFDRYGNVLDGPAIDSIIISSK